MTATTAIEDLLRDLTPQVLGTLVRRHGQFDRCEDAVQEALLAGALQWPVEGVPANPRSWLVTVASRRLIDEWRSEGRRREREVTVSAWRAPEPHDVEDEDDTLTLIFLCCHPCLTGPSQLALTLRAVGGLTTSQIARAFLVPDATMAQRISRAKSAIREEGARFEPPSGEEAADRLRIVMQVLYLIFNEGYTPGPGGDIDRSDLAAEAIRLTRLLHRLMPQEGEVAGLLALMLLTDARRPARLDQRGALVPLGEQRRELWDRDQIAEGTALLEATLGRQPPGSYQVQAAIAALHDTAATPEDTDWPQIVTLYHVLERLAPSPVVTLNRAVAAAMVHGPQRGLTVLADLDTDPHMSRSHRLEAVRGHLLELAGDRNGARRSYRIAARMTASTLERRYLMVRAAHLASPLDA